MVDIASDDLVAAARRVETARVRRRRPQRTSQVCALHSESMPQDQHYMPKAYLRQWCDSGKLVLYRRLARPPKVLVDRKSPKSIAHAPDLYRLPSNTTANGRTDNDIENLLGDKVDQRIAAIARGVAACTDKIEGSLASNVVWLMKTFIARSPKTLAKMEAAAAKSVAANSELIDSSLARAPDVPELRQLKDARMPRVAARAALVTAVEVADLLRPWGWLEGDVHVLHAAEFANELNNIGAGEFVTFEDPVIEWGANSSGFVASFALSPDLLIVVEPRGSAISREQYATIVRNHLLDPIPYRQNLICRSETKELYARAGQLLPTTLSDIQT